MLRRRQWPLFGLAGTNLFDVLLDFIGAGLSLGCLIPIIIIVAGHLVANFDLRHRDWRALIIVGIDEVQRDFGHSGGFALTRAGKDDIFHARAAQGFCRLLAEHPGNGIGDVRFSATVGTNDGRNAIARELEFRAIAKRFEAQNLDLLEFKQVQLLACSRSLAASIKNWLPACFRKGRPSLSVAPLESGHAHRLCAWLLPIHGLELQRKDEPNPI